MSLQELQEQVTAQQLNETAPTPACYCDRKEKVPRSCFPSFLHQNLKTDPKSQVDEACPRDGVHHATHWGCCKMESDFGTFMGFTVTTPPDKLKNGWESDSQTLSPGPSSCASPLAVLVQFGTNQKL